MISDLIQNGPQAWPNLSEANLPTLYVKRGPNGLISAAKEELDERFGLSELSNSEGVYLRWCVQHFLRVYQMQEAEIATGKLSKNSRIRVHYEAAVRWIHDLYAEGYYASEICETDRFGLHDGTGGPRTERFREFFELVNVRRARATDISSDTTAREHRRAREVD